MFVTFENLFQSYSVWKKLVNIYWSDHRDKERTLDSQTRTITSTRILSIAYITREEPASFWRENVVIAVVLLLRNLAGMS